jgi:hypothetical protein
VPAFPASTAAVSWPCVPGAVPLAVGREPREAGVGDPLKRFGQVEHVVVGFVARAEGVELLRERLLGVAHFADGEHDAAAAGSRAALRSPNCPTSAIPSRASVRKRSASMPPPRAPT